MYTCKYSHKKVHVYVQMCTHDHIKAEVNRNNKSRIHNFNSELLLSLLEGKELFTLITKGHDLKSSSGV